MIADVNFIFNVIFFFNLPSYVLCFVKIVYGRSSYLTVELCSADVALGSEIAKCPIKYTPRKIN